MENTIISVREMIKDLMEQGFSEEAIAYGVKVNKSTISRIVTGKTHSPRYHLANSIEAIFGLYARENNRD